MNQQKLLQKMIGMTLVALFLAACGAPAATSTPVPPTPTPVPPTATPETEDFQVVTEAVSKLVEDLSVRQFALCHLQAALWGGYDVEVQVGRGTTVDDQSHIFRMSESKFSDEISSESMGGQLATVEGKGVVLIGSQEEAFEKGIPFYITDVVFETPVLFNYTVVSNPNTSVDNAFPRIVMIGEITRSEVVQKLEPLSSNPEPQRHSWEPNGPLDGSRKTYLSILTLDVGDIRCLASNEVYLEPLAESAK